MAKLRESVFAGLQVPRAFQIAPESLEKVRQLLGAVDYIRLEPGEVVEAFYNNAHMSKALSLAKCIILTNHRLIKLEGGKVLCDWPYARIKTVEHLKNNAFRYDKLLATFSPPHTGAPNAAHFLPEDAPPVLRLPIHASDTCGILSRSVAAWMTRIIALAIASGGLLAPRAVGAGAASTQDFLASLSRSSSFSRLSVLDAGEELKQDDDGGEQPESSRNGRHRRTASKSSRKQGKPQPIAFVRQPTVEIHLGGGDGGDDDLGGSSDLDSDYDDYHHGNEDGGHGPGQRDYDHSQIPNNNNSNDNNNNNSNDNSQNHIYNPYANVNPPGGPGIVQSVGGVDVAVAGGVSSVPRVAGGAGGDHSVSPQAVPIIGGIGGESISPSQASPSPSQASSSQPPLSGAVKLVSGSGLGGGGGGMKSVGPGAGAGVVVQIGDDDDSGFALCDECEDRRGELWCRECRALFCRRCDGALHSSKVASRHRREVRDEFDD